jgi:TrmH family RNA methyltransferase
VETINSLQNSRIKNIRKLSTKARERKEQELFVIEGAREFSLALAGGYVPDSVYVCRELFAQSDYPDVLQPVPATKVYEVSESVFQTIAYREGSDGILALARPKPHRLPDLRLPDNPLIIVLEAVEKPGNLGAVLRTADAAQVDAVIVCDPSTDLYNPNIIRSGVGCLFTVPVAVASNDETLKFLQNHRIQTFAAELKAAQRYQDTDFTSPSALVLGSEADGLSDFWLKQADRRIKIPMRGVIDSLNVSVTAAVLTFEAMRQRGF